MKKDLSKMNKKLLAAAAIAAAAVIPGLDQRLAVRRYTIKTHKLKRCARLVLLSDLHGCRYGRKSETLTNFVKLASPDAVLMAGDMFDDRMPEKNTLSLFDAIGEKYRCFYVMGNHEIWSNKSAEMAAKASSRGITVLNGEKKSFDCGGIIDVCGVTDPYASMYKETLSDITGGGSKGTPEQIGELSSSLVPEHFNLLLTHRPELVHLYSGAGFDLVTAGHAHGGQWRIPLLVNGFYAPGQGSFPAYAGGKYTLDDGTTRMIVSRGLARESTPIPRFYNRPEFVMIEITPL